MIDVVLPTYNGAPYLEAQLASIHSQTLCPKRIFIRDDGSNDGTSSLISDLHRRYGAWLQVLPSDGNLGCSANVNLLLEATSAPYVALADQDDIWLPQKLEQSLMLMQQLEATYGVNTPLLLHSDLDLVDSHLSLWDLPHATSRLDPRRTDPMDLALTNVVTGCTTLLNRSSPEGAADT